MRIHSFEWACVDGFEPTRRRVGMTAIDRSVRVRSALDAWLLLIVVVLVLLTSVLGWWAYQVNVVPEIEDQQRVVEQWSESTTYDHSAVITNGTLVWDRGDRVTNRPLYYVRVADDLDSTYGYEYAAERGEVTVSTESYLVVRGVDSGDSEEVFWEVTEPLATGTTEGLAPGDSHTVDATVNITAVLETIATVETQLAAREGLVDVRVVSVSTVDGVVEGTAVSHTYTSELPMVVTPQTFRVIELETIDEEHQTFETVGVVVEPTTFESIGSIALFALSAVALLSVLLGKYTGYVDLTDEERELLAIERDRERFTDWISQGTFPAEREYDSTVLVDSLEGLVDVAIDTNKRVIEDSQLGVSTVLDNDYIYIYVRPDSPARDWLVNYADTTIDEFQRYEF
ncbi:MAG: DUF5305 domain-containing protein [Halobacteriota archaeon]